jgi:hypothetical protein
MYLDFISRTILYKDDVGQAMKSDGPGEIIYFHCDMRKEEEVKVHIVSFSLKSL